ncbi:MAG: hypothetical protein KGI78_00975 [Patescibacteria group bacterium]|nr:hypothetical protein [Patescibacteria group bacterium]MDE1944612.1 hypothetical protein [Patescibacteria group bacterium]MDE1945265.1 hypothetical protein [Patescibacteria group bacterium]MDE2057409.1 hypothetical protein [Patescibacteria group bacterium]
MSKLSGFSLPARILASGVSISIFGFFVFNVAASCTGATLFEDAPLLSLALIPVAVVASVAVLLCYAVAARLQKRAERWAQYLAWLAWLSFVTCSIAMGIAAFAHSDAAAGVAFALLVATFVFAGIATMLRGELHA